MKEFLMQWRKQEKRNKELQEPSLSKDPNVTKAGEQLAKICSLIKQEQDHISSLTALISQQAKTRSVSPHNISVQPSTHKPHLLPDPNPYSDQRDISPSAHNHSLFSNANDLSQINYGSNNTDLDPFPPNDQADLKIDKDQYGLFDKCTKQTPSIETHKDDPISQEHSQESSLNIHKIKEEAAKNFEKELEQARQEMEQRHEEEKKQMEERFRKEIEQMTEKEQKEKGEMKKKIQVYVQKLMAKKDAEVNYLRERELRKKIQNDFVDYRGKIRVYCRIRPICDEEIKNGEVECVKELDEFTVGFDENKTQSYD